MKRLFVIFIALSLLFSGCGVTYYETNRVEESYDITGTEYIENIINELASDTFKGRYSGTEGNDLAVNLINKEFTDIGLEPVFGDNFLHEYQQESINMDNSKVILSSIFQYGTTKEYIYGTDFFDKVRSKTYENTLNVRFKSKENNDVENIAYVLEDSSNAKNLGLNRNVALIVSESFFGGAFVTDNPPQIQITKDVYEELKEKDAKKIYLKSNYKIEPIKAMNVAGRIVGTDSAKAVVISAHFDHVGWAGETVFNGAVDNASGTTIVLDLARKLQAESRENPFATDIVFVAFNGEESGLKGSSAFIKDISSKYDQLYNINIDCVGKRDGGDIVVDNDDILNKELNNAFMSYLDEFDVSYVKDHIGTSDHKSFISNGFSGISIGQQNIFGKAGIHTNLDTIDSIDVEFLESLSNTLAKFIRKNDGIIFTLNEELEESVSTKDEDIISKLIELNADKNLAFDEMYITEIDGRLCEIHGDRSLYSAEEVGKYYPNIKLNIPESILDNNFLSIKIYNGTEMYVVHDLNDKIYTEDQINAIVKRKLSEDAITMIMLDYSVNDVGLHIYIIKNTAPAFLNESFNLEEVEVNSQKFYINTHKNYEVTEGFYREIIINDTPYHVIVRKMGPNFKDIPMGSYTLRLPNNTREEVINLIEEIDIDKFLEELNY